MLDAGWDYAGNNSRGLQSLTREQDAQAEPYFPGFLCSPDAQLDEPAIQHFYWTMRHAASSREVRAIKEMQVQRRLDQLLPPPTDEYCLAIRTALMERQEFFKWAQRERDIHELQARLRTSGHAEARTCSFPVPLI